MSQPNIIVCLCDMLRAFELGCYGNQVVRSPHLDRLAAQGVRFELAVSNNPVCTPARSCLMSGQYSRRCTGMTGNTNDVWPLRKRTIFPQPTLAEVLRNAGYHTELIGKWHIENDPLACGFDQAVYPHIVHRHYGQQYVRQRGEPFVVDAFAPDFEHEQLKTFFANRGEEPYFLFHSISQPHMPVGEGNLPQRYRGMYRREEMSLRPNVYIDGKMAHDREWFITYTNPDYWYRRMLGESPRPTDTVPDDYDLIELTRDYLEMVTCTDDQVGNLMRLVEQSEQADNTIVVFLSDHGDNLGSHHRFNKQLLIEESIRIPMIFWWPGQLEPAVNTRQVASLIDVMPTLLSLAGVACPSGLDGRSLAGVMSSNDALPDNHALIESPNGLIGIRTATHMLGMRIDPQSHAIIDERFEFFDLRDDPYEQKNLAGIGGQASLADELAATLREWHETTPWTPREA